MDALTESLLVLWDGFLRMVPRLVAAIVVVGVAAGVGRATSRGARTILERGHLSAAHLGFFSSLARWFVLGLGLAVALWILGLHGALRGFLAGGGLTAVILGFAFRDIGENFLAGLLLAFDRHFDIDDVIQCDEYVGTVQEISLRSTHIRTDDGRDIFIPSARIFGSPLTNYTRDGLRRPGFTVGIDYADDAERARGLILDAVRTVPGVLTDPAPTVFVGNLAAQYVEMHVHVWIDTFDRETGMGLVLSTAQERTRIALLDNGFTVSSNVSTAVDLKAAPLSVSLEDQAQA